MATSTTQISLSDAIEEHRKALGDLQRVVNATLSNVTDDVLEGTHPRIGSVFATRRMTAIQTHLDAAKYSVNAALFYARGAKEEHDAD